MRSVRQISTPGAPISSGFIKYGRFVAKVGTCKELQSRTSVELTNHVRDRNRHRQQCPNADEQLNRKEYEQRSCERFFAFGKDAKCGEVQTRPY